jgi:predicted phage tail protein
MEGMKKTAVGPIASPSLVMYPKPLGGERIERFQAFLPGETLGAYVRRAGLAVPSRVVRVEHNGREVPLALWKNLIPRHGDLVVISARALGGGGGGKVLRTVAMLAVVAAAFYAPYLAGLTQTVNGVTSVTLGGTLLSAGVMIGGSLLVNALLPLPTPTAAKLGTGEKYESSPTYAIQGGRNRMRLWEPMMLVMGKHKVVFDLAAAPYTVQSDDDQYLMQAFHAGLQGTAVEISDLKIGDTAITNYEGVRVERSGPDGALTTVAGNVDTIQGFTIRYEDGWQTRTTGTNVSALVVDLAARLYSINDSGTIDPRTVDVRIQYRRVGDSDWIDQARIEAVYASYYWALLDRQTGAQVSYGSTNPGEHSDGQLEEYDPALAYVSDGSAGVGVWRWTPHPYSRGQPWYGVAPDPVVSPGIPGVRITGARQEPIRRSIVWDVPIGQYDIRISKSTPDINGSRDSNETAVSQILAYQVDSGEYSGQARLGVIVKATGQLNGAIDELNGIVTALCPVWDGSRWVTGPTSNPAWWFLWFARGKTLNTRRIYGGGLSDSQIDIEGIKAWAAWCDAKGLTFDYVLDRKMSTAAVLQIIARAGRAAMTYQTGHLGVVWDAENRPVSAMFGPFNVKAGSFKVSYTNDGTVDEVVLNFVNKSNGWKMDEVRVRVPGATTTNNPLQLDLDGCTNKEMAGREANLIAASQVWKRRKITWETDIEGLVCTRGDVVSFSHDLTVWGYSGRLMPGSGGTLMKLQQRVPSSGSGTVMLRDPDGNLKVLTVSSATGEVDELTIVSDLDGFPMPGDPGYEDCSPFDWAWQFDPLATPGRRFKVSGVTPAGEGLRFEAVDDDPEYYASEFDPYQYTPPRDGALLRGIVLSISGSEQIESYATDQIRFTLAWVLSSDSESLVSVVVNGLQRLSQVVAGRSIDMLVSTGDVLDVTITPRRSTGAGEPKRQTFTIQGLLAPLPAVTGLQSVFRDGLTWLTWNRVADPRQPAYEVRLGTSWGNSQVVATTVATEQVAVANGMYWVAARFALASGQLVYGPPASILIAGAILQRNVILSRSEAPEWDGALAGGALVLDGNLTLAAQGDWFASPDLYAEPDLLWMGGAAPSGTFTVAEASRVDVGYVTPVRLDAQIDFTAISQEDDLFAVADWFAMPDMLNGSARSAITAKAQIRWAQEAGEWTEWADLVPGLVNARFFDVRLYLATSDNTIIPTVTRFEWSVDVPDLIQHGEALTVPAAGLRVDFPKVFHARPNLQITVLDAQDGDREVVPASTSDASGFNVTIFNGATPVARQINWIAQGY